jgi:alpha-ribazole phosphatase
LSRSACLVRHTVPLVAAGTCYGASDVPVIEADFAQALPELHAQLPHNARLITSPLTRCARLAQALCDAAPHRTLQADARLVEMNFGRWEGVLWDDVPREELDAWAANFTHYTGHGGESVAQLSKRVLQAWAEHSVEALHDEKPLVLITHAGPMRAIHAHSQGYEIAPDSRVTFHFAQVWELQL